ncbi:alpha/beta hydrolase [Tenacibaculum maritimum]|uniref:alpha/beta hydrolase n=1 Tax=Tenacibaculum maritimum TaxID=107401 RepID=UPI0003F897CA|nr:alpha/beta hydrolase [Tenacibaculum maritimum]MCD9585015.1 alpha/beta hydrolase [Tenacibaculum maritimum]MCD9620797.1 alpha/beta hydrolase [Tenacibaculum maritimum]MCD9626918.1 alpha/beta hydrolase [Tenacibaculum maritimum]MCD9629581.1 alpha/beta hydrolase [Tenacibaculum maritimum]MCD9632594.1 alpha/beta hydrolase [Tenacibaculum maritimum]
MEHQIFKFNIHKTTFFGQYWSAIKTRAVVVIVHGMGEHSSRYEHVAKKLTENNFSVVAFDQFGHGKTTGKRGHNPNFNAVLESVAQTIKKTKELFPKKPIFLYGHSMGGNVVINYVLREENSLKGAIATSAFLRLAFEPPAWKLSLGKLMQKIAPSVTLSNELAAKDISRDAEEVQKYIDDKLIHDKVSPNFSLTFIETGEWAIQNASSLKIPLFLAHGTNDKIIDYKGSELFAKASEKATLSLYEGGYHELHNDLCKEEVLEDIINWLNTQL